MAENYTQLQPLFTDIADAIRHKTGTTDPIPAKNFPDEIEDMLVLDKVVSITITTPPDKTEYVTGARFDSTGMVAQVTYKSGDTKTVTNYEVVDTTITSDQVTITYTENGVTVSTTQTVTLIEFEPILNDNSPELIQRIAKNGIAQNCWSVGDRIRIDLTGTVGAKTFNNSPWYAYILGFNHNETYEGKGIHFCFGFNSLSSSMNMCFIDSYYYYEYAAGTFKMKTNTQNNGGWKTSYLRVNICSAFLAAMPSAWQAVIAVTTKYTDNVGGGTGSVQSNISATDDQIFIPSLYEVLGTTVGSIYTNSYEASYQRQYAYYANGNSKVKFAYSNSSSGGIWWTRSTGVTTNTTWAYIGGTGAGGGYYPDYSYGFAPCFRVG